MPAAASVGAVAAAATTIPAARVGRRPVILAGAIGCVLWALPMFGALNTRNGLVITGAFTWLNSHWASPPALGGYVPETRDGKFEL
ncbi:hypothetical protein [Streptomyces sp. UG1]|uniref:hypothetical protein n=1 Tax=Streptomyces sp. UG1 TaxID=3417652 RepID=UPI003CF93ED4